MNDENTNVYELTKEYFPSECSSVNFNNPHIESFVRCNTFDTIADDNPNNHYFYNPSIDQHYFLYTKDNNIIYVPTIDGLISKDAKKKYEIICFSIGREILCIRVNRNGLYIEISNLHGKITTYYYKAWTCWKIIYGYNKDTDWIEIVPVEIIKSLLEAIIHEGSLIEGMPLETIFNIGSITPEKIKEIYGIDPDYVITMSENLNNFFVGDTIKYEAIIEQNGELLDRVCIEPLPNDDLYSTFYKFMIRQNYYLEWSYILHTSKKQNRGK